MLPTVARIFVSSTWLDLQPERHAVEDAINRMNAGKFVGMEYFGSRPNTTEGASLEEVDRSDIYVGIIGGRYGSGITEKEYRRALHRHSFTEWRRRGRTAPAHKSLVLRQREDRKSRRA